MPPQSVCFIINDEVTNICPSSDASRTKWQAPISSTINLKLHVPSNGESDGLPDSVKKKYIIPFNKTKLTSTADEPQYAITRIEKLIETGRINLAGDPLISIVLINDNSEQITLYEALANDSRTVVDAPRQVISESSDEAGTSGEHPAVQKSNLSAVTSKPRLGDEWGINDTKYILDKYLQYMAKVGPMKTFKTKKIMWNRISIDFYGKFKITRSAVQIENRFKTVLRRKKDAVNNNSKSGSSRQDIPFEEELSKIAAMDDSVEPELLRSSKKTKIFKQARSRRNESGIDVSDSNEDEDSSRETIKKKINKKDNDPKKRKRSLSNAELILKLHNEKENAKQQRHIEKMNLMKKLFGGHDNSDESS